MSFTVIFTAIIILLLLRVFWLRMKASGTRNESFKQLAPKDRLAVLKECLLNNPTERNLSNLENFGKEQNLSFKVEEYRPLITRQLELARKKDGLVEDDQLFAEEARWMDSIEPLEFQEAREAEPDDRPLFIQRSAEGIARLYSDEAIQSALEKLVPEYSKAQALLDSYKKLMDLRDQSTASDKDLEILRKARDQWMTDLLDIQI